MAAKSILPKWRGRDGYKKNQNRPRAAIGFFRANGPKWNEGIQIATLRILFGCSLSLSSAITDDGKKGIQ
jgi:hypothetical protein